MFDLVKWGVELKMNWLNWSIPISSGFQFQFNSNSKSFNSIPIQFMLNWIELIINSNSIHELIRALVTNENKITPKDTNILRMYLYTPAQQSWRGGILDSPCPSVCPSVRPSVCRRHGFRSISQGCFGISISNFICMLMVAISRSVLIFSDVTFKMVAWRPYWIFWFPDSNFTLALNINFKLQRHNTYVYG